jgi:hypothetical protein
VACWQAVREALCACLPSAPGGRPGSSKAAPQLVVRGRSPHVASYMRCSFDRLLLLTLSSAAVAGPLEASQKQLRIAGPVGATTTVTFTVTNTSDKVGSACLALLAALGDPVRYPQQADAGD